MFDVVARHQCLKAPIVSVPVDHKAWKICSLPAIPVYVHVCRSPTCVGSRVPSLPPLIQEESREVTALTWCKSSLARADEQKNTASFLRRAAYRSATLGHIARLDSTRRRRRSPVSLPKFWVSKIKEVVLTTRTVEATTKRHSQPKSSISGMTIVFLISNGAGEGLSECNHLFLQVPPQILCGSSGLYFAVQIQSASPFAREGLTHSYRPHCTTHEMDGRLHFEKI